VTGETIGTETVTGAMSETAVGETTETVTGETTETEGGRTRAGTEVGRTGGTVGMRVEAN
jgi:hypothetical protein